MSLFTNDNIHPKLYRSAYLNSSTNQAYYQINNLQSILEAQAELNNHLSLSVKDLDGHVKVSSAENSRNFEQIFKLMDETHSFKSEFYEAVKENGEAHNKSVKLVEHLESMLANEGLISQAILGEVSLYGETVQNLSSKLEQYESFTKELEKKLQSHEDLYEGIFTKLDLQEVFHKTVMEKLDHQEALSQKLSRQVEYLRTIIFERAADIIERIESNISKVSKPVQKFFIPGEKEKIK